MTAPDGAPQFCPADPLAAAGLDCDWLHLWALAAGVGGKGIRTRGVDHRKLRPPVRPPTDVAAHGIPCCGGGNANAGRLQTNHTVPGCLALSPSPAFSPPHLTAFSSSSHAGFHGKVEVNLSTGQTSSSAKKFFTTCLPEISAGGLRTQSFFSERFFLCSA